MSSTFQTYDLHLAANASTRLPVNGNYFLVLTQTGKITARGNFGLLKNLGVAQGMKGQEFKEIFIEDASGASNDMTILVGMSDGGAEFVNLQTIIASSSAIALDAATITTLRQPFVSTGNYANQTPMLANTPQTVLAPAANLLGVLILNSFMKTAFGGPGLSYGALIAKATAPTSLIDGEVVAFTSLAAGDNTGFSLQSPQLIAPGLGLYFISSAAETAGIRSCRYRLL